MNIPRSWSWVNRNAGIHIEAVSYHCKALNVLILSSYSSIVLAQKLVGLIAVRAEEEIIHHKSVKTGKLFFIEDFSQPVICGAVFYTCRVDTILQLIFRSLHVAPRSTIQFKRNAPLRHSWTWAQLYIKNSRSGSPLLVWNSCLSYFLDHIHLKEYSICGKWDHGLVTVAYDKS